MAHSVSYYQRLYDFFKKRCPILPEGKCFNNNIDKFKQQFLTVHNLTIVYIRAATNYSCGCYGFFRRKFHHLGSAVTIADMTQEQPRDINMTATNCIIKKNAIISLIDRILEIDPCSDFANFCRAIKLCTGWKSSPLDHEASSPNKYKVADLDTAP